MPQSNFYFMAGEDTFSLLEEVDRWKSGFLEKYGDTDIEELDGETVAVETIAGAIQAMPFLSPKRLVILKNFLSGKKAEQANELIPVLEKLPDSTFLLMAELTEPDKRSSLFKHLTTAATQRLFLKPKGAQLNLWIRRHIEALHGQIDPGTADYLASWVGDELFRLHNEIEKLTLFAQGKPISPAMIDELVADQVQKSIFILTDLLAQKKHAEALATLKKLEQQGEEAGYLFAMVTRQFRLLLEMKALADQGQNAAAIARTMAVHPFVVQNTLRYAKNFTYEQLQTALSDLLTLDRRLKTGLISLKPREEDPFLLQLEKIILS
ncbi:DNA polymerase III subunit delta [Candidatus Peregrinibacteria bacterium]|nr:MAG: DNA polymerase III subunit delta [Candidatus Peregrinibacteria bacterium]